ncbi:MAG: hypothetical protein RLZZ225_715 [Pseudomonadota bacterium]|jgi:hypothetical protein
MFKKRNKKKDKLTTKYDKHIHELLDNGIITGEDERNLTREQRLNFKFEGLCQLINKRVLSFEEVRDLNGEQCDILEDKNNRKLYALLCAEIITLERFFELNEIQQSNCDVALNLSTSSIIQLILDKKITLDQALVLTHEQRGFLSNPRTVEAVINGNLSIEDFFREEGINDHQSTYTPSFYQSVSAVVDNTLLIPAMESLSLTADESGAASYGGGIASGFWQQPDPNFSDNDEISLYDDGRWGFVNRNQ